MFGCSNGCSRGCFKITIFAVNFSFQEVTQAVKRKAKEHEDYSPAGGIVFFPYVCLVQIQCIEKPLEVKVVTAMLKS